MSLNQKSIIFLPTQKSDMPVGNRKLCLSRSPKKMGFSLRSSCKAQGFIKRVSGKRFKSPKYSRKSRSNSKRRSSKSKRKSRRSKKVKSRTSLYENPSSSKSGKVVLMIGADWCPYCRKAKPHFNNLLHQYSDRLSGHFVDIEANPKEAAKYRTGTIPTFVFLRGGKQVSVLQDSNPDTLGRYFRDFAKA